MYLLSMTTTMDTCIMGDCFCFLFLRGEGNTSYCMYWGNPCDMLRYTIYVIRIGVITVYTRVVGIAFQGDTLYHVHTRTSD